MALFESSTILFDIQSLISLCISHGTANYVLPLTLSKIINDRSKKYLW